MGFSNSTVNKQEEETFGPEIRVLHPGGHIAVFMLGTSTTRFRNGEDKETIGAEQSHQSRKSLKV